MLIVQPDSAFGDLICKELDSGKDGARRWQAFEFATAWVNRTGADRIKDSARKFLAAGGRIRATVGLDFSSTSYEGLSSLLDLEDGPAEISTHVFFDENPACTFHPKIFLFSNAEQARLLVGSNNMTGAGLDSNVEAALAVTAQLDDERVQAAREALAEWRDIRTRPRTTRRLTRELLKELREQGYVRTEEEIHAHRSSQRRSRSSEADPLFGRSSTAADKRSHRTGGGQEDRADVREVLLMRVRPRRNGKQIQISMRVLNGSFMNGATEVVSTDGSQREIGYNEARGVPNTARFEAPEMVNMENPVARFEWIDVGGSGRETKKVLQFEIFDADSDSEGAKILRRLEEGIATPPGRNLNQLSEDETLLSTSDRERAQWYRLDSE